MFRSLSHKGGWLGQKYPFMEMFSKPLSQFTPQYPLSHGIFGGGMEDESNCNAVEDSQIAFNGETLEEDSYNDLGNLNDKNADCSNIECAYGDEACDTSTTFNSEIPRDYEPSESVLLSDTPQGNSDHVKTKVLEIPKGKGGFLVGLPKRITSLIRKKPTLIATFSTIFFFLLIALPAGLAVKNKFKKMQKSLHKMKELDRVKSTSYTKDMDNMLEELNKLQGSYEKEIEGMKTENESNFGDIRNELRRESEIRNGLGENVANIENKVQDTELKIESLKLEQQEQKSDVIILKQDIESGLESVDRRLSASEANQDQFGDLIAGDMDTYGIRLDSRLENFENRFEGGLKSVESNIGGLSEDLNDMQKNLKGQIRDLSSSVDREVETLTIALSNTDEKLARNVESQVQASQLLEARVNEQIRNSQRSLSDQMQGEVIPKLEQLGEELKEVDTKHRKRGDDQASAAANLLLQIDVVSQEITALDRKTKEEIKQVNEAIDHVDKKSSEGSNENAQAILVLNNTITNDKHDLVENLGQVKTSFDLSLNQLDSKLGNLEREHNGLYEKCESLSQRIDRNDREQASQNTEIIQLSNDLNQLSEGQKNQGKELSERIKMHGESLHKLSECEKELGQNLIVIKKETNEFISKNGVELKDFRKNCKIMLPKYTTLEKN